MSGTRDHGALRVIEATAAVTGTTLSDVDAIRFLDTVGDEEPIAA